ncbi:MAG: Synechococcus phage [Actinomycetota bacterium]|jgi:prefoldin subunit 5
MIEALITGVVSLIVGVGSGVMTIHGKSNSRMDTIDKRIDDIELRLAEKYVPRQELATALQKMEDHMIRIENKLDQIVLRNG